MQTLDWIGKKAVVEHHQEVPFRLLREVPDLSVGDADSGNLLIQQGDLFEEFEKTHILILLANPVRLPLAAKTATDTTSSAVHR